MYEGKIVEVTLWRVAGNRYIADRRFEAVVAGFHPKIGLTLVSPDTGEELLCLDSGDGNDPFLNRDGFGLAPMVEQGFLDLAIGAATIPGESVGRVVETCAFTSAEDRALQEAAAALFDKKEAAAL